MVINSGSPGPAPIIRTSYLPKFKIILIKPTIQSSLILDEVDKVRLYAILPKFIGSGECSFLFILFLSAL